MSVNKTLRWRIHSIGMLVQSFKRNENMDFEVLLDAIEEACVNARADLMEWEREQSIGQAAAKIEGERRQFTLDDYVEGEG